MPLSFPLRRSSSCRLSCSTLSTADCSSACFSWNRLLTCSISAAGCEKWRNHISSFIHSFFEHKIAACCMKNLFCRKNTYTGCHWWPCCSPPGLSLPESSWALPPGSPRGPSASAASRSLKQFAADAAPAASGNANVAPTENETKINVLQGNRKVKNQTVWMDIKPARHHPKAYKISVWQTYYKTRLNLSTVCTKWYAVLCQDWLKANERVRWLHLSTRLRTVPVKVLK